MRELMGAIWQLGVALAGAAWSLVGLAWRLAVSVATCALILVAACCLLLL